MESCTTWECVNSFAPWLSAIGTILISGLALWLSVRDRFIRLSADFSGAVIANKIENNRVYSLHFVNIGPRDVRVVNFEWHWGGVLFLKPKIAFIQPYLNETVASLSSKLPVKLSDGESATLFFRLDFIEQLDDPQSFLFPKRNMKAIFRIFTSEIYLCTSVGKKIRVKIKPGIRLELWRRYRKYNKSE